MGGCKCAESKPIEPPPKVPDVVDAQRQADLDALPKAGGSLPDQLAAEAAARPAGTPTLEKVIEVSGVPFGAPRQLWGVKQLAIYCASADSADGMIVSVCEYPSEAQAGRGEKEANIIQSKLPLHQSRVHKKSVLHVVPRSDTPAESVKKVIDAFEAQ
ncbi:MAG: hypothetical protein QM817_38600 [Archangium sp.]